MARTYKEQSKLRGAHGEVVPLPWLGRRRPVPAPRRVTPKDPDDYLVSDRALLAVGVFIAVLIVGSVWLLETMRTNAILEECLMAGRRNCVPIVMPLKDR